MTTQEASGTQAGIRKRQDGLLDLMKRTGVPLTRKHYLNLAYVGEPLKELSAEQEAELPEQFRKKPSPAEDPHHKIHPRRENFQSEEDYQEALAYARHRIQGTRHR